MKTSLSLLPEIGIGLCCLLFSFSSCNKSCRDNRKYHIFKEELNEYTHTQSDGNWFEYSGSIQQEYDSLFFSDHYHSFLEMDCDEYEIKHIDALSEYQHFISGKIILKALDDYRSYFSLTSDNPGRFKSCFLGYDRRTGLFYTNDHFTNPARVADTLIDNNFYEDLLINDEAGCAFAKHIGIIYYTTPQDTFFLKQYHVYKRLASGIQNSLKISVILSELPRRLRRGIHPMRL